MNLVWFVAALCCPSSSCAVLRSVLDAFVPDRTVRRAAPRLCLCLVLSARLAQRCLRTSTPLPFVGPMRFLVGRSAGLAAARMGARWGLRFLSFQGAYGSSKVMTGVAAITGRGDIKGLGSGVWRVSGPPGKGSEHFLVDF